MMGNNMETIEDVPSGNICALVGVDRYLMKTDWHHHHNMVTSILLRWRVARRLTSWGRTVLMMGNNMESIEDVPARGGYTECIDVEFSSRYRGSRYICCCNLNVSPVWNPAALHPWSAPSQPSASPE